MRKYCGIHDVYFCEACDVWLEKVCSDPDCEFCPTRPQRPSGCQHDSSLHVASRKPHPVETGLSRLAEISSTVVRGWESVDVSQPAGEVGSDGEPVMNDKPAGIPQRTGPSKLGALLSRSTAARYAFIVGLAVASYATTGLVGDRWGSAGQAVFMAGFLGVVLSVAAFVLMRRLRRPPSVEGERPAESS